MTNITKDWYLEKKKIWWKLARPNQPNSTDFTWGREKSYHLKRSCLKKHKTVDTAQRMDASNIACNRTYTDGKYSSSAAKD